MRAMSNRAADRRVIGIDLGGTKLAAGVISGDLQVHHRTTRPSHGLGKQQVIDLIVDSVNDLLEQNGDAAPVEAIGLGIPSLIDQASGTAVVSVHLPLTDLPIRGMMNERLGLPVALDNDGNVQALAEQRFGAARGRHDIVMIGVGTGISGGIIIEDKVFRGSTGSGAEIGHMTLQFDGPPCAGACPNLGCFETMVSGTAIGRYAREHATANPDSALGLALASGREVDGALAGELAHEGDPGAIEVMNRAGRYLGAGLVGIANIFNPEMIVIGGGAAAGAGDLLITPAKEHFAKYGMAPNNTHASVVPAAFGADAGMLGSAVMAFIECLDEPLREV
jgi:glucokinase